MHKTFFFIQIQNVVQGISDSRSFFVPSLTYCRDFLKMASKIRNFKFIWLNIIQWCHKSPIVEIGYYSYIKKYSNMYTYLR